MQKYIRKRLAYEEERARKAQMVFFREQEKALREDIKNKKKQKAAALEQRRQEKKAIREQKQREEERKKHLRMMKKAVREQKAAALEQRRQEKKAVREQKAAALEQRRQEKKAIREQKAEALEQRRQEKKAVREQKAAALEQRRQEKRAIREQKAAALEQRRQEKKVVREQKAAALEQRRQEKKAIREQKQREEERKKYLRMTKNKQCKPDVVLVERKNTTDPSLDADPRARRDANTARFFQRAFSVGAQHYIHNWMIKAANDVDISPLIVRTKTGHTLQFSREEIPEGHLFWCVSHPNARKMPGSKSYKKKTPQPIKQESFRNIKRLKKRLAYIAHLYMARSNEEAHHIAHCIRAILRAEQLTEKDCFYYRKTIKVIEKYIKPCPLLLALYAQTPDPHNPKPAVQARLEKKSIESIKGFELFYGLPVDVRYENNLISISCPLLYVNGYGDNYEEAKQDFDEMFFEQWDALGENNSDELSSGAIIVKKRLQVLVKKAPPKQKIKRRGLLLTGKE